MFNKYRALILTLALSIHATIAQGYPMPALSKKSIEDKFVAAEQGFAKRWQAFAKNRKFKPYTQLLPDAQIHAEFEQIIATRNGVYYENPGQQPLFANPDYDRSQELLAGGFYKAPHLIAFNYNCSHPSYNSSNITLNGYRFLALEGPQKPEHVANFKRLLINYDVKKVVRLTTDVENGVFKSENYWHDNISQKDSGQEMLTYVLPEEEKRNPYSFTYYAVDDWQDDSGTDHKVLLDLVQQVRRDYQPGDLIAVHCSAGVGRTGTFIASFLILDEIDKQLQKGVPAANLKISIEETVYKLSLQRAYLVGQPSQYLTLHKLVQEYLAIRSANYASN